jgi:thiamine biosynthesis lipoprotein
MACRFEITVPAELSAGVGACCAALDEVERLEAQLSVFREDSEVSRLNRTASTTGFAATPALVALLERCALLHHDSGGAFDPTSGPLTRCWGFFRRAGAVPPPDPLAAAQSVVGMSHVHIDPATMRVSFARRGVELNFGSIGKGHALDCGARTLRRHGVSTALLSAGSSSVLAVGPSWSGRSWPVGLRDPRARDRRWAVLHLREAAMATSGSGEQFFTTQGRRYGHILDPRTGHPADACLAATVVASCAAEADALATAFFVGGTARAQAYCATHDNVLALIHEEGVAKPAIVGRHGGCRVQIC